MGHPSSFVEPPIDHFAVWGRYSSLPKPPSPQPCPHLDSGLHVAWRLSLHLRLLPFPLHSHFTNKILGHLIPTLGDCFLEDLDYHSGAVHVFSAHPAKPNSLEKLSRILPAGGAAHSECPLPPVLPHQTQSGQSPLREKVFPFSRSHLPNLAVLQRLA